MKQIPQLKQLLTLVILPAALVCALNAKAAIPHFSSGNITDADGWLIAGGMNGADINGIGVAKFTLFRDSSGVDTNQRNITFATSLAIPPLLGMSLSRLITRHSSYFENSFWPNLIGAYAGAGLSMGSLALLHHATAEPISEGNVQFQSSTSISAEAAAFSAFFQVLLPMALPGLGAAAGYAMGKAPKPGDTEVSFLSPTLFRSPSPNRERKYILGVQLISARF